MKNPEPKHPAILLYQVEPIKYEVTHFVAMPKDGLAYIEYNAASLAEVIEMYIPLEYCEAWLEENAPDLVKEFSFLEIDEDGQRERVVYWFDLFYYDLPIEFQNGILNDFINNGGKIK